MHPNSCSAQVPVLEVQWIIRINFYIFLQDFQKAQCLLISEVAILLEHRQKSRSEDGTDSSLSTYDGNYISCTYIVKIFGLQSL